ncbi:hypothetical protein VTH82DRAFT_8435 [Thermothelomyces myriococcoides]
MIDIEGAERNWSVRESVNRDPRKSMQYYGQYRVKTFSVGHGVAGRNNTQLHDSIYNSRIDNNDEEWNCQNWLEDTLLRLKAARFLTEGEVEAALDAAFDMVLAAPQEPIPN